MSQQQLVEYVFMWHALSDACPICRTLNGKEWRDQSIFKNTLWDPFYGDIWNMDAGHTLVHPNCRCQLEVRVEQVAPETIRKLLQMAISLRDELRSMVEKLI